MRWRIINLSSGPHAMHLHGFYFTVESSGDIDIERRQQRMVVTERIERAATFMMSWTPELPGNWLFHCHMTVHMNAPAAGGHADHEADDSAAGRGDSCLGFR